MTRSRKSAKAAGTRSPVLCAQCGRTRWLLHPQLAGEMCRPCAARLASDVAQVANTQDMSIRFRAHVLEGDDCWLWTGLVQSNGYGVFNVAGRPQRAHRVSYEMHVGPIPPGLQIDHLCRVRKCVNPAHLEPVTARENSRRAMRTHCVNGHEFTSENTYMNGGKRYCRTCRRDRNRSRA